MTGNLILRSDNRMHFAILNGDGNARMWLYKDKVGNGIHLSNGIDGGGDFVFHNSGEFYSPSNLRAGEIVFQTNGDIYGGIWGGYLSNWLNNNFYLLNNSISSRATQSWVNQNFVQNIRLTTPIEYSERGLNERVPGGVMTSWADYGGSNYHIKWRLLQKLINGQWVTAEYT
ncbi:hypothetical protein J9T75_000209 [Salmonella enterica]|nr:hypothetical protein [Salmonella enterica]